MVIKIDDLNINYTDTGSGPAIVLLHGWGSSCDAYNYIVKSFSEHFRMIAVDFPGFGKSDMIPCPWDVSDYVDITVKFLQKLNIQKPTLIGHSFGGRVIIKMVGQGLIEPDKIILIDSAGVKPKKKFSSVLRTRCFKIAKKFLLLPIIKNYSESALNKLRAYFGSADYNNAPPLLRQTLVKVVNEDLKEYMKPIKCPTLLIWGENDTATPVSDAKIMESLINDSGLCIIKGAGHFSFIDSPYEVNAIISSFLEVGKA